MAISYPVSEDSRWAIWSISGNAIVGKNKRWPRADGEAVTGADADLVYLLETKEARPTYDGWTQKLQATETVDVAANTVTYGWQIVALDQSEQDALIPPHYTTTSGIKLKTDEASQNAFANLLTLLNQAGTPDTDMVTVKDATGNMHAMTFADFKAEIVAYGVHCYTEFLN